jgi:hypothetical protein
MSLSAFSFVAASVVNDSIFKVVVTKEGRKKREDW